MVPIVLGVVALVAIIMGMLVVSVIRRAQSHIDATRSDVSPVAPITRGSAFTGAQETARRTRQLARGIIRTN